VATYVLVGGAWIGGWAWKRVAAELRSHGHDVYPATLTGLGDRVHLARPEVDLDTHITDVVNLIEFEDLSDVVLTGHSYGGLVVTGVADRIGDRLAHLVYVDSAPVADGESLMDFFERLGDQGETRKTVAEAGEGWRLPPPPFADLPMSPTFEGLSDADRAYLSAKSVPQPFRTYTQPLRLTAKNTANYTRTIIACNDFRQLVGSGLLRFQIYTSPEWRVDHLNNTGHWPMLSAPSELADILNRLATS
jgi:pimeloyl-ACP methyl ester carboxylesterase